MVVPVAVRAAAACGILRKCGYCCDCWHCPRASLVIAYKFCFCQRRSTPASSLHLPSTCRRNFREHGPKWSDQVLTQRLVISQLYQAVRSQPAMPGNPTGTATSFVSSRHSNSSNHSRSNNAHLSKLKRRNHLSSNLSNINSSSSSNKGFHRQHSLSSQRINKRTSEHSRRHQNNLMVVATSSHLLACELTAMRSSRPTVSVASHSALLKTHKRKAVDSRRNFRSARPAIPQHKPNKPL